MDERQHFVVVHIWHSTLSADIRTQSLSILRLHAFKYILTRQQLCHFSHIPQRSAALHYVHVTRCSISQSSPRSSAYFRAHIVHKTEPQSPFVRLAQSPFSNVHFMYTATVHFTSPALPHFKRSMYAVCTLSVRAITNRVTHSVRHALRPRCTESVHRHVHPPMSASQPLTWSLCTDRVHIMYATSNPKVLGH